MEIQIPKIFEKLELKNYAKEFGEAALNVWVNPPRAMLNERMNLITQIIALKDEFEADIKRLKATRERKEHGQELTDLISKKSAALNEKIDPLNDALETWYAGVLFEGERPITKDEFHEMLEATRETDPQFVFWVIDSIMDLIANHREKKKN